MKTFEDLDFNEHSLEIDGAGIHACMDFDNGKGISVLCGRAWYSNGLNTYEILSDSLNNGEPIGHISKDKVTEYMKELQSEETNK